MAERAISLDELRPAYSRLFLGDAMQNLATFFDYAINDYGAEGDEVFDLLAMSEAGRAFAMGDPHFVSGMSGFELFDALDRECGYVGGQLPLPTIRLDKTLEFWIGWSAAYVQWRLDLTFEQLFRIIPYERYRDLYGVAHEADCEWLAYRAASWLQEDRGPTMLARARTRLGLSQRELAHRSGVTLRSIQMYEQRNKDINKAQAATLARLASCLHVPMERLLEPDAAGVTLPAGFAA